MPNIFDQVLHIKINSFHQAAIFHVKSSLIIVNGNLLFSNSIIKRKRKKIIR